MNRIVLGDPAIPIAVGGFVEKDDVARVDICVHAGVLMIASATTSRRYT